MDGKIEGWKDGRTDRCIGQKYSSMYISRAAFIIVKPLFTFLSAAALLFGLDLDCSIISTVSCYFHAIFTKQRENLKTRKPENNQRSSS